MQSLLFRCRNNTLRSARRQSTPPPTPRYPNAPADLNYHGAELWAYSSFSTFWGPGLGPLGLNCRLNWCENLTIITPAVDYHCAAQRPSEMFQEHMCAMPIVGAWPQNPNISSTITLRAQDDWCTVVMKIGGTPQAYIFVHVGLMMIVQPITCPFYPTRFQYLE